MDKETIQDLLRNGTGLDSLEHLTEGSMEAVSTFRSLFPEAFAAVVADVKDKDKDKNTDKDIPPLLSDWNFALRLNDASLVSLRKYLECVSACPEAAANALSQKLADNLRAGCKEQYFGRVVRLLLFEVFSGEAAASPAAGVLGNLLCFSRYWDTEKDGDVDAIRLAARIGNALVPAKDKLNLGDPLSSFPAWAAVTCFAPSGDAGQGSFQDLVAVSEGRGAISPFLLGARELYSDGALLAALGHFLREGGCRANTHAIGCLVHFLGVARSKRAEVLALLRKHVEDAGDDTESLSYLLLLARLCGTKQQYGQWLLGVVAETKAPARVVESLTNLIPIDSPEWISAHISILQKATKALEGCREYTRCGQMKLEAREKEKKVKEKNGEAAAAAGSAQRPQESQDPEAFIDAAFREFFLTKKLPQSIRGAAFFNTSWFNETIVPLLFSRAKKEDPSFTEFMSCIAKAGIQLKERKRRQSAEESVLLTSSVSSLRIPGLSEAFEALKEACSAGTTREALDAIRSIDRVLSSDSLGSQPLCPALVSEFLRLTGTDQFKYDGSQEVWTQSYVETCFLKRKEAIIEVNALLLHLFTTRFSSDESGDNGNDGENIENDHSLIRGISVLLALVMRARGPKEFLNLWQHLQPRTTHHAIVKLRLGLLIIQALNESRTTVSLSQDSTPSSDDSLRPLSGRSFLGEVTLPPPFFHELYILHQAIFCSPEGVRPGSDAEAMCECSRALRSVHISQRVVIAMKIQPRREWLAQELAAGGLLTKDAALGNERMKMAFTYQHSLMGSQFLTEMLALAMRAIEENGMSVSPQTASVLTCLAEAAHLRTEETDQPWVWGVFGCNRGERGDPCTKCSPGSMASFWIACSFLPGFILFSGLSSEISSQTLCNIIDAHALTSGPFCK